MTNMMKLAQLGSLVAVSFGSEVGVPEESYKVDHLIIALLILLVAR